MKLLFGCGYLGTRIARRWRDGGAAVTIVTRSPAKASALQAEGYGTVVADVCDPATLTELPRAETIVFAVGYDRQAATTGAARSIEAVYAGGVRNVLEAVQGSGFRVQGTNATLSGNPEPGTANPEPLFLYVSSTGVYGDAEGEWVDESTPCRPLREGGRACLAAEQAIATHPLGARGVVLRLAGIYGPNRIPRAESLRRGEPIDAPSDGFLNLIHVDDAARIVLDVERAAQAGRIALPRTYCVSDGRPPLRREYYGELARLLDAPPPKFVAPQAECRAMLRAAADKRISNSHLLAEIEPRLQYPSYREGLAAIVTHRASSA